MLSLIAGLFAGAFVTNVAIALLPHEPLVVWYGQVLGVPMTVAVATAGTVVACYADRLLFYRIIAGRSLTLRRGLFGAMIRGFDRAPFGILVLSGLTPFPFWPFKLLAFASEYPTAKYLSAIALGRVPRYALLAWLGVALPFPSWVLPVCCVLITAWVLVSHLRERGKDGSWTTTTPPSGSPRASPPIGSDGTSPASHERSPGG